MNLSDDPRWQAIATRDLLAGLGFDAPDAWPHGPRPAGQKALAVADDSLSERYCTLAGHRFLRARLGLPIRGAREVLTLETWASVSEATWTAVLAARTAGAEFEGGFTWLSNVLPGLAPEPVGCNLLPGRPGEPPRLFAQEGPLHQAQQTGLALDALVALLGALGRSL